MFDCHKNICRRRKLKSLVPRLFVVNIPRKQTLNSTEPSSLDQIEHFIFLDITEQEPEGSKSSCFSIPLPSFQHNIANTFYQTVIWIVYYQILTLCTYLIKYRKKNEFKLFQSLLNAIQNPKTTEKIGGGKKDRKSVV